MSTEHMIYQRRLRRTKRQSINFIPSAEENVWRAVVSRLCKLDLAVEARLDSPEEVLYQCSIHTLLGHSYLALTGTSIYPTLRENF